jgi:succinyl-CoA synthetase alpha subunit
MLNKKDHIAVSNITGREASKVSLVSQSYAPNLVGGWALGRGGQSLQDNEAVAPIKGIPVFATFEELLRTLPREQHPNKILIYSPPEAVYGEVKEIVKHGADVVETIFIVTEHVAIEVTSKIYDICQKARIDLVGCNTLGMINVHEHIRIGAVGGDDPAESFQPGSVTIISNSGNMVNTIASYLLAAGMGVSFGISTGKDPLILFPLADWLALAEKDKNTKMVVLYLEPGGLYEEAALRRIQAHGFSKPLVVYVTGIIAGKYSVSLGHAGAVVEGKMTSAQAKMLAFDDYFGLPPYLAEKRYKKTPELKAALTRGIRVTTLHHIPRAVTLLANQLEIKKDFAHSRFLRLNPWFVNLGELGRLVPSELALPPGTIPEPYREQFKLQEQAFLTSLIRQPMRNASHASANDGATPRVYGYALTQLMQRSSLTAALILYWTGELPEDPFEERLAEMTLIASLTNGPGTISAQGAKLACSAGNSPHTAMIATLASIGLVHGGNGSKAVQFLLQNFAKISLANPYHALKPAEVQALAVKAAAAFRQRKLHAKEAGIEYELIPCLGHPVFRNDAVNYDPRERVISAHIRQAGRRNIFLEFYHYLAQALKENGSTGNVLAVNVDAAIACVWLALCWKRVYEKQMTIRRVTDIPFIAFALGRAAGGAGEFLDHQDFGTEMDMRIPVNECQNLTRDREVK